MAAFPLSPARRARLLVLIVAGCWGCAETPDQAPAPGPPSGGAEAAQAIRLLRQGDPRSALDLLMREASLERPEHAALVGEAALRSGQYALAEKAFRRVLQSRPGDLTASVRLARLAWLGARYSDSLSQLDWILARSPDLKEARALRSRVRLRLGDLDGAAADARRWSELAPAEAGPQRILGSIQLLRGDAAGAIPFLRRAVALEPADLPSRLDLGRAYAAAGEARLADEAFREAGRLEKEQRAAAGRRAEATYDRARALDLLRQGNAREALESFDRALRRDPDNPDLLREAGEAALAAGEPRRAREYLDRAVQASPGNPRIRLSRGEALLSAGDPELALTDLREAARIDPDDPESHRALARAYGALHRPEAEPERQRAEELEKLASPPPLADPL